MEWWGANFVLALGVQLLQPAPCLKTIEWLYFMREWLGPSTDGKEVFHS